MKLVRGGEGGTCPQRPPSHLGSTSGDIDGFFHTIIPFLLEFISLHYGALLEINIHLGSKCKFFSFSEKFN